MICRICDENPCVCARTGSGTTTDARIITHCNYPVGPSCNVAIRHRPGQLGNPLCKWHQNGTAYVPSAAPEGCPDPVNPWPWKTPREQEEEARKPYWQNKFKQHPALYARWINE